MNLNLAATAFQDSLSLPSTDHGLAEARTIWPGIPTSKQLTGIELRLSRVFILDNKQAYVPWIIRYSDLYLLLTAIDDISPQPQTVSIKGIPDVDDNEELPVERTAYYWKATKPDDKAPGQIHLVVSVVKSNSGIRDTGSALEDLKKSTEYGNIVQSLVSAVATGGGSAVADTLLTATGLLGSLLGKVDDTPLITTVMSFTDLDGVFDQLGRHVLTRKNRYAEIETTLIVRDSNREPA